MKQLPVGTRSRMAFKEAEFCTKNVPFFPNSKLDWLPLRFILKSVSHYLRHEVRLVFKTTAQMAQFVLFLLDDAWHSIKCDRSLSIQYFFDELFHLAPKRVASCCDYFWRSPCYSLVSRRDLRSAIISSAFVMATSLRRRRSECRTPTILRSFFATGCTSVAPVFACFLKWPFLPFCMARYYLTVTSPVVGEELW